MNVSKQIFKVTLPFFCVLFVANASAQITADACIKYNMLNTQIRDQVISKKQAIPEFIKLIQSIDQYYTYKTGKSNKTDQWKFPLDGYGIEVAGGKNGNGYIAYGYDFYAGNKHGGHPAHDLFIHDTNQDGIDDKTHKEVMVLAACAGVVVATENNWQSGSEQRGGNYIWIYSPLQRRLFYYAHNNQVLVKPGDIVNQGFPIATVGRTGANAAKKRSPTHLHFMVLKLDDENYPKPENPYARLKDCR